jgi:glycosyltransferase involved in cell wall biosynthesis
MRIGIDARPASEITAGIGTYVRELLREFTALDHDHELVLFARTRWEGLKPDSRVRWVLNADADVKWNVRAALRASRECNVYLSTCSYLTPWFLTIPSVIVVQDMIAFDRARLAHHKFARVQRATIRPALRRARRVIAISQSTRRDLVESFPHTAKKVCVVPDAAQDRFTTERCNDDEVTRKYHLNRPYVIAVGTLEPRKNLTRLIEAFVLLPDDLRAQYDLVLVGASGWDTDDTFSAIAQHAPAVRALGYVADEDLPALYRNAVLLAFPSIYEGFGLPVLEAMQCGTPVLAGLTSSIPEVGGDAVRYVDPLSVEEIRAGLEHLLRHPDERRRMESLGLERAKQFSWTRTATATLEVLEAAVREPAGGR